MNVMWQTSCLVLNLVTVYNLTSHLKCTPAGPNDGSDLKTLNEVG